MLGTGTRGGRSRRRGSAALLVVVLTCFAPVLAAQNGGRVSYSIDWHGPTVGQPANISGTLITEGDILLPALADPAFGPLPRPQIFLTGGQLALSRYAQCLGHQGGTPCGIEVDALSYGTDGQFHCNDSLAHIFFSVDEHAVGNSQSLLVPSVRSEGSAGARDAAADIFVSLTLPPGPLPPGAAFPECVGTIDGDGLPIGAGPHYRGIGLLEPDPPGLPPDPGDNLDALDMNPLPPLSGHVYFSLDASFNDPLLGIPNSGSAQANSVLPGAVLKKQISASTFTIFAQPNQLGLDRFGPGTDDLDGLILSENGDGVFQPSQQPCDWVGSGLLGGPTDMLLFSVRRGSAVVGMPDSIFGLPIEPGDVLTTPKVGGLSVFPGIYIAAEDLGLATARSGQVAMGDEMDAMSSRLVPFFDCNGNGVEDSVDIAQGSSADANNNGIPDECERTWQRYCLCTSGMGPCGNDDATAGCANSTGGGASLDPSGSTSLEADDLVLTTTHMPAFKLGIYLMSSGQASTPLGDGLRCVGSPFHRFGSFNSGALGSAMKGPGIISSACSTLPPAYCIHIASTWNFQTWYRNLAGPCGGGSNLTNGVQVTFGP